MEHVTLNVNQDVLIVPVLDLQDVTYQTVGAERVCEVFHGLLILFRACLAKLTPEVVYDGGIGAASFLFN